MTVQGSGGGAYSASIDLIYPEPTINSVNITSAYNNINITMNITKPEYGWQSTLINNDTSEVKQVIGDQYGMTERFTNMTNGDWVYRITGDEEFVSEIFTLNYNPPIPPIQLIEPNGGTFVDVHDLKYFETTPSGRFLYGLINKGETERHLDGNLNDVEYDSIEKVWYDVGIFFPKKWNENIGDPIYDVWPTTANMQTQFWFNDNDSLEFQFNDPYFATPYSIITSEPILTQVDETYTIQVIGNDNLETEGWYYSINGASYNFTTDSIQTRSFSTNQTATVTVQGTDGDEFTSSIDLVIPPGEYFERIEPTGGSWESDYEYYHIETTSEGRYLYSLVDKNTVNIISDVYDVEYNPSDKKWYDVGSSDPYGWSQDTDDGMAAILSFPTAANLQTHYWYDVNLYLKFQFIDPYYVAPEPVVEPVARIVATGGDWDGSFDYYHFETTSEGRFVYGFVRKGSTDRNDEIYDFEYDPSDGKFYDVGSFIPHKWGIDDIGTNLSAFPTSSNMETHYFYHENGDLKFQFENPYYVAPDEPVVEPVERLVATGGD